MLLCCFDRPLLRLALMLSLLLSSVTVGAQSAPAAQDEWSLTFYLENDLFANTDRNYTNGVRASLVSPDLASFRDEAGQRFALVDWLGERLSFFHPEPLSGKNPELNIVASIGQLMFTPEDKRRTSLDPDDRPYAGWLYLGVGFHARTDRYLNSFEFNIGMVGPAALAQESQNLIHDLLDVEKFNGWDHQLANELGVRLVFEQKHRWLEYALPIGHNLSMELIPHWGLTLGNVNTHANLGAEWRIGYNLPQDFGTSTLKPGGDNSSPGKGNINLRPWQWQFFIAADGRAVARNIFLDGNTFADSHSVNKRELVADIAVGVAIARRRWRLSYAHVYRTREFVGQELAQKYGAVSLSYSHPW